MTILKRMPAVSVSYDRRTGRQTKKFTDAYKARRFYVAKLKVGKRPTVGRANA